MFPTNLKSLILSSKSLSQTQQSHSQATILGLLDLPTAAALLLSYSDHHSPLSSTLLFDRSSHYHHLPFIWNTLIRSLNKAQLHSQAFGVYNEMARKGVRPDDRTFPFVLKVCADAREDQKGREVHGRALKCGLCADVFVGNTLVGFHGACGMVRDAWKVFDEMGNRDVVSWNSMVSVFLGCGCFREALGCFRGLVGSGVGVNSVSMVSALPACVGVGDRVVGMEIHGLLLKVGLDLNVTITNALVDMYIKCGDPEASLQVFEDMPEKNEVSWNSVIGGFIYICEFVDALLVFRAMIDGQVKVNSTTISSILPALVEMRLLNLGQEVHGHTIRTLMDEDVFVANSLLDMYAKCGCTKAASEVFNRIRKKNTISWNIMIANFAHNMAEMKAIELVREMQLNGESPHAVTFTNVLPACSRMASLRHGKEIHAKAIHVGCCFDLFVSNALMDMYAKCGRLNLATNIFRISKRDDVSYNTLIVGFSQSWQCLESLHYFLEMRLAGFEYDEVSYMGTLCACANMSALKQGKEIHGMIVRKVFHDHLFVANSLLDLYTKSGQLDIAKRVFDHMSTKDVASWNAIILGYAMQGDHDTTFNLFEFMKRENVVHDSVSFIAVLSACSHGGFVERGKGYFNEMLSLKIEPTQMHYACMVDLLGRAGLMKEALEFINDMPFEPDSNVWGALLGACRVYGDLEYGRLAAERLFLLKPGHSGYYILLSNMYAEAGRWDEATEIRARMKTRGVKKNPGYSWVEAGKKTHAFMVSDRMEQVNTSLSNSYE